MSQLFFFRVDANEQIGTGHLMRCLALADELNQRGGKCTFILQNPTQEIIKIIKKNGHLVSKLPETSVSPTKNQAPGYERWLTLHWKSDALATLDIIGSKTENNWIIVDHYGIDHKWHTLVKKTELKLLVIDDLIEKKIEADILVNQNIFFEHETKKLIKNSPSRTLLLGPQYALLRNEFKNQELKKSISQKIGVMFGGADQENFTQTCVTTLINNGVNVETVVIVGALYKYKNELLKSIKGYPRFRVYQAVNNVHELIADASLVIGSPGISSLERCALGIPSINISIADNQIRPGKALSELGTSIYLGKATNVKGANLIHATQLLLNNKHLRNHLSKNARSLCDGNGITKIANLIIKKDFQIRVALEQDAKQIFLWRNSKSTRINSISTEKISWSTHKKWFLQSIKDPNRIILIAETNSESIGCLRADMEKDKATISIFLNPNLIGRGYGADMLQKLEKWLIKHHPQIKLLQAQVLPLNTASQKIFEKAGYQKKSINYIKVT